MGARQPVSAVFCSAVFSTTAVISFLRGSRGNRQDTEPSVSCTKRARRVRARAVAQRGDAQAKLARIFPALKSWFAEDRFCGCPFINAVGEHDKDQKQFRNIALKHKKIVLSHIEKLAGELGRPSPRCSRISAGF